MVAQSVLVMGASSSSRLSVNSVWMVKLLVVLSFLVALICGSVNVCGLSPGQVLNEITTPEVSDPVDVVLDGMANMYVLDSTPYGVTLSASHNRIVKMSPNGTILNYFYDGFNRAQALAIDTNGNIYVADSNNGRIVVLSPDGTQLNVFTYDDGYGTPGDLAVDSVGRLYVADWYNGGVFVFNTTDGSLLNEIYPPPDGMQAWGVAVDSFDYLYVSDSQEDRVIKFSNDGSGDELESYWGPGWWFPRALAVDANGGNIYVADYYPPYDIYVISTVDGSIKTAFDDNWDYVWGITIDPSGNLYVADPYRHQILVVASNGTVLQTFAYGVPNAYGVAVDAAENIYVLDTVRSHIIVISPNGTQRQDISFYVNVVGFTIGGRSLALDLSTNIYVAQYVYTVTEYATTIGPGQISVLSSNGTRLRVVPGAFTFPTSIAVDASSNMYVLDNHNGQRVVVMAPDGTLLNTFTSGLYLVLSMALDNLGNFYLSDQNTGGVFVFDATTGVQVNAFWGFVVPSSMAVDDLGYLYVFDLWALSGIGVFNASTGVQVAGPYNDEFSASTALVVGKSGNIYVADISNTRIVVLSSSGAQVDVFLVQFGNPLCVAVDPNTGNIYVTENRNLGIVVLSPSGQQVNEAANSIFTGNYSPFPVFSFDMFGNLYVLDASMNVDVFSPGGVLLQSFWSGLWGSPQSVAADGFGDIYVVDNAYDQIVVFSPFGAPLAGLNPGFWGVNCLTVDLAGNVYATDSGNVWVLSPTGSVLNQFTGFNYPWGIAVDVFDNIYVVNQGESTVVVMAPNGTQLYEFTDDFGAPEGIALDPLGNIYVADTNNDRIVVLSSIYEQLGAPTINSIGQTTVNTHVVNPFTVLIIVSPPSSELTLVGYQVSWSSTSPVPISSASVTSFLVTSLASSSQTLSFTDPTLPLGEQVTFSVSAITATNIILSSPSSVIDPDNDALSVDGNVVNDIIDGNTATGWSPVATSQTFYSQFAFASGYLNPITGIQVVVDVNSAPTTPTNIAVVNGPYSDTSNSATVITLANCAVPSIIAFTGVVNCAFDNPVITTNLTAVFSAPSTSTTINIYEVKFVAHTGSTVGLPAAFTTALVPVAPNFNTIQQTGIQQATVSWNPSLGATSYSVYYTAVSSGGSSLATPATVSASTLTYTFQSIQVSPGGNGVNYTFSVYATNSAGSSQITSTSAATPLLIAGQAAAPSIVSIIQTNADTVSLSVVAGVHSGGAPISGFDVWWSSSQTSFSSFYPISTSASLSTQHSLPVVSSSFLSLSGVNITFTVAAVTGLSGTNVTGSNGYVGSPTRQSLILARIPSAPLSIIGQSYMNRSSLVTFVPNTNTGGAPILSYTISCVSTTTTAPNSCPSVTIYPPSTSVLITALKNGVNYTFSIVATNFVGNSLPAQTTTPVLPAIPPSAVNINTVHVVNAADVLLQLVEDIVFGLDVSPPKPGDLAITFTSSATNVPPITSYTLVAVASDGSAPTLTYNLGLNNITEASTPLFPANTFIIPVASNAQQGVGVSSSSVTVNTIGSQTCGFTFSNPTLPAFTLTPSTSTSSVALNPTNAIVYADGASTSNNGFSSCSTSGGLYHQTNAATNTWATSYINGHGQAQTSYTGFTVSGPQLRFVSASTANATYVSQIFGNKRLRVEMQCSGNNGVSCLEFMINPTGVVLSPAQNNPTNTQLPQQQSYNMVLYANNAAGIGTPAKFNYTYA